MFSRITKLNLFIITFLLIVISCSKDEKSPIESETPQNNYTIVAEQNTTIEISDDFILEIPSGTIDDDTQFSIKELETLDGNSIEGLQQHGKIFEINYNGDPLKNTVSIYFKIPENIPKEELLVCRYNGSEWEILKTHYSENKNMLVTETPGFSIFTLFSGNSIVVGIPKVTPSEYSGIRIDNYEFKEDLKVSVSMTDPDNEIETVGIKISFRTFESVGVKTLQNILDLVTSATNPLILLSSPFIDEDSNNPTVIFQMEQVSSKIFEFTMSKSVFYEMYKAGANFDKIFIKIYAQNKNGHETPSDEIIVPILAVARPSIQLISPQHAATILPTFSWQWNFQDADYTVTLEDWVEYGSFKIIVDNSENPFKSYSFKTWTHEEKIKDADFTTPNIKCGKELSIGKTYSWGIILSKDNNWGNSDDVRSEILSFTVNLEENNPPNAPTSPNPADRAENQETSLTISWECSDPDNDPITYDIYFGVSDYRDKIADKHEDAYFDLQGLDEQTEYTWQIIASDNNGNQTVGEIWTFYTKSEVSKSIVVTSPNSSTILTQGQQNVPIIWDAGTLGGTVEINIWRPNPNYYDLTINESTENDGNYSTWDVPSDIPPASDYRIRIRSLTDNSVWDDSEEFEITSTSPGEIDITNPNSSTIWTQGQQNVPIEWETGNLGGDVEIWLWLDDGGLPNNMQLTSSTPNDGSFSTWDVPEDIQPNTNYKIRIYMVNNSSIVDNSEKFEIKSTSTGEINITNPNSSTVWTQGQQNVPIEWNTGNLGSDVEIWLWLDDGGLPNNMQLTSSTPNDGSFSTWDVPEDIQPNTNYKIRIYMVNNSSIVDNSEKFEIKSVGNQKPVVSITTPSSPQSGDIELYYSVSDAEGDNNNFRISYRVGSANWALTVYTTSAGRIDELNGIYDIPPGNHYFVWDSEIDIPEELKENIEVIIGWVNPQNGEEEIIAITNPFDVDNRSTSDGGEPCPDIPTITYAGKTYNTVLIGEQCWLKENLDVGTKLNSNSSSDNQTDNGIIEKYCYDNDEANCDTYGGLYQWNEAMQYVTTEGTQGICPSGWHIPTNAEFRVLETFVNDEAAKLIDESQITSGYTATNVTGFSALFAGSRYDYNGDFGNLSKNTHFWSSTEINSSSTFSMNMYYSNSNVYLDNGSKNNGFSVRCLKD